MGRIFITGSADGLGQLAAQSLMSQGHDIVLHARNAERAKAAKRHAPGAAEVVIGDLSSHEETISVAQQVNALGVFDAVIHNAGVYQVPRNLIFSVNTVAPYVLTSLIQKPKRLVYMSSGMHHQGRFKPEELINGGSASYSDSKLHVVLLSFAVARLWKDVCSNAVDPGWVPTKMGGRGAPDDLTKGYETQVWLAASEDPKAKVSGHYFYHKEQTSHNLEANDISLQNQFLKLCQTITGVALPS